MGGRIGAGYQQGWRIWKLGAYAAGRTIPYSALLAGPAQSAVMTTPAVVVPDNPLAYQAFFTRFNFDRDPALADVTTPDHPRSVTSLISARNARLTAFRARGGKLLIPHGMSDPIFSFHDTRQWWEELDQHTGGNAADFVRLYAVPGMAHCGGGPATDRYDCLDAVVRWVEQGAAPDRIVATAGPGTDWPGRSRPLCPWPSMARYRGTGSLEVAASFACVTPPARDR
jgi:feruloyl esterase